MKNVLKNLWNKFFKKTEEPSLETKIDLGLKAYMSQNEVKIEPVPKIEVFEIPAPQVVILETLSEPKEVLIKVKRKYTKKEPVKKVPIKKVALKKVTKKEPIKKATVKKAITKKNTIKNKK